MHYRERSRRLNLFGGLMIGAIVGVAIGILGRGLRA
jgi:hypothetical protein